MRHELRHREPDSDNGLALLQSLTRDLHALSKEVIFCYRRISSTTAIARVRASRTIRHSALLDEAAEIHRADRVRHVLDQGQVVSDQHETKREALLRPTCSRRPASSMSVTG